MRKFIFFDIDGTLTCGIPGENFIPSSAALAVKKLQEAGHFVAIATGRSQALSVDFMHEAGLTNMVSDGGYGITINGELQGIEELDHEKLYALADECDAKGVPWGAFIENAPVRVTRDGRFEEIAHDIYAKTCIVPDLDLRKCPHIYKLNIICSAGEEDNFETLKALPWARFQDEYIFIEPADKSYGIKKMVAHEGGDIKDVIVFGDGKNDLSMFIPEWTSVAMGNAIDELKAKATYITDTNENDGIYKACEYLQLF